MKRYIFILLIFFSCSTNSDETVIPELPDPYVAVKFASFKYSLGSIYGGLVIYTHKDYSCGGNCCSCSACNDSFYDVEELYYNKENGTVKFKLAEESNFTYRKFDSSWTCRKYEEI
jgi:hypothetical protein